MEYGQRGEARTAVYSRAIETARVGDLRLGGDDSPRWLRNDASEEDSAPAIRSLKATRCVAVHRTSKAGARLLGRDDSAMKLLQEVVRGGSKHPRRPAPAEGEGEAHWLKVIVDTRPSGLRPAYN